MSRKSRAQAGISAVTLIPLIALISMLVVSALNAGLLLRQGYEEAALRAEKSLEEELSVSVEEGELIIVNTGASQAEISAIYLGNPQGAEKLNVTIRLYPGEEYRMPLNSSITEAFVATSAGKIYVYRKDVGISEDSWRTLYTAKYLNTTYRGLFLGGYVLDLAPDSWRIIDKRGIVENIDSWTFDQDDTAYIVFKHLVPTIQEITLKGWGSYAIWNGASRTSAFTSPKYYDFENSDTSLSKYYRRTMIDPSSLYKKYTTPALRDAPARIDVSVYLSGSLTSGVDSVVRVYSSDGSINYTWPIASLGVKGFRIEYDSSTGLSRCSGSVSGYFKGRLYVEFEPDPSYTGSYAVHVSYTFGIAATYAVYTGELVSADTPGAWIAVEYMGRNYTIPYNPPHRDTLLIYTESETVNIRIYAPIRVKLETDKSYTVLSSYNDGDAVARMNGGYIAISPSTGEPLSLQGSSLTLRPIQNAEARIEYVQTIPRITVLGVPLGSTIRCGGEVLRIQDWGPIELRAETPLDHIEVDVPLALAIRRDGSAEPLETTLQVGISSYRLLVQVPSNTSRLILLLPPGSSTASLDGFPLEVVDVGAWRQVVVESPSPGTLDVEAWK